MDIDVGELVTKEEGTLGVCDLDNLVDFLLQLGNIVELFGEGLLLQDAVEERDNIAVDLGKLV